MAKLRKSEAVPFHFMLVSDVLTLLLSIVPASLAYFLTFFILYSSWQTPLFYLWAILSPWILCLGLVLIVFVVRLFLPRLKKGSFKIGASGGFVAWALHFNLNRAITVSGLKNIVFSSSLLRFLYLRAMGAKVPFALNGSMGVDFSDCPMIEIGEGTTLGEGVFISCHTWTGEWLMIAPVKIGKNTFIGYKCTIGPNTFIGNECWIGSDNLFGGDKIPSKTQFPSGIRQKGKPPKGEQPDIMWGQDE